MAKGVYRSEKEGFSTGKFQAKRPSPACHLHSYNGLRGRPGGLSCTQAWGHPSRAQRTTSMQCEQLPAAGPPSRPALVHLSQRGPSVV